MSDSDSNRIFIVEDDLQQADMLSAFFDTLGYEVFTSAWGEEAVEGIGEQLPDVVLLDINLPDIDGYEVCRRLRRTRRTKHLPVIFLTKRRALKDKLAGLELGAVDYIAKPFDVQELRLRVRNALHRSQLKALHNPITGLPEGPLVKERLEEMLQEEEWGLVFTTVQGLDKFRDRYGFVAADDVTRALGLMIANAVQENSVSDTFIGHTNPEEFVIVTDSVQCEELARRCRLRLEPSLPYFYPASDRPGLDRLPEAERLSVRVACLRSRDGEYQQIGDLGAALSGLFQ